MRLSWLLLAGTILAGATGAVLLNHRFADLPITPLRIAPIETTPLCPWRTPEEDMRLFFPGSTAYRTETRILSGVRPQLQKELGRMPAAGENALHVHRIYEGELFLGSILTERVKGEYGGIELVVGIEPSGAILGLRYQRLREPGEVAAALQQPKWLEAFREKTAANNFRSGDDLPLVSPDALPSARAVADGVRSLLILFRMSESLRSQ